MKNSLIRNVLMILTVSFFLNSCDRVYHREFFSEVNFRHNIDENNWWYIDSLGVKDDSMIAYKFELKFGNTIIKETYCSYLEDVFYIKNDDGNFEKYFDLSLNQNQSIVNSNGEVYLIDKDKENYYYLMSNSLDVRDVFPPSKYSIWVINKTKGFFAFAYYDEYKNTINRQVGDSRIISKEVLTLVFNKIYNNK